ncbi:hypothetical protein [Listeria phage LMTA-57]|uniref:Uncharacterized protein n=3 Tax=Pecentumvirus TaxID=1857844 RepID=A0A060AFY5_9CAUD|nr:hypothetical protein HH39_gp130 [Listeria phage LMSP-25]YP_009616246.1 hypothetical protein FDI77_gp130 [Listeria phage LMTA-34]YP_009793399.1 hypothetical protein QLX42_gp096 [Listeria phage LMTA-57]QIG60868.1 hypothetical protein vBLinoVEfB7_125 [Listeria phage vB_Lino_VEfB7]AIA64486.1 hypothetical protein [Listeria phage LMSP-25]AID17044.1 hypothetical protein [Listeria phage LMTA-34]AID17550.1 hypothetical protein [Listeria phage LMTA-57]
MKDFTQYFKEVQDAQKREDSETVERLAVEYGDKTITYKELRHTLGSVLLPLIIGTMEINKQLADTSLDIVINMLEKESVLSEDTLIDLRQLITSMKQSVEGGEGENE